MQRVKNRLLRWANVRRIPRDVDMFTGEVVTKPRKRGNGNHILLHDPTPKPVGMAYFPGTGPEGKYCQDCEHFGNLEVWRNGRITPAASSRESEPKRIERDACEKAARMLEGIPQKGGIGPNRSCKYFMQKEMSAKDSAPSTERPEGNT